MDTLLQSGGWHLRAYANSLSKRRAMSSNLIFNYLALSLLFYHLTFLPSLFSNFLTLFCN